MPLSVGAVSGYDYNIAEQATAGVALMSEFLVGSVNQAAIALGMNKVFVGVIVVAIIGNAAEHSTAVLMASKELADGMASFFTEGK